MAQKLINQFFDQVEYPMYQSVCMLCVKTMRDMTAKLQDGYKKMQCMWILNTNDAWKKILVKNIETENFSISNDRALIKYQSSQADSNQKLLSQFRSVERQIQLILSIFWKTEHFNAETPQSTMFYE